MKKTGKIVFYFVFINLFLLNINISYSQFLQNLKKLSFGNDRNPSFRVRDDGYNISNIPFEFLIYERVNGNASNILVSKINTDGALDSGYYLTNDVFANINPSIGYYFQTNQVSEISTAFAVWETDKNGNKDIYARIYKQNQGWLPEFSIDNSAGEQANPKAAMFNGSIYAVVYQSANDIKLKLINVVNQSVLLDTNLTLGIIDICKNPYIVISQGSSPTMYITYEREFSASQNSIYCLKSSLPAPLNFMIDTVRYSGVNYNAGMAPMFFYPSPYLFIYESDKNGKRNVFGTQIKFNGQSSVSYDVLTSQYFDLWGYSGTEFFIGKNTTNGVFAFISKQSNSLYAKVKMGGFWGDSLTALISNDTNYKSKTGFSTCQYVPNTASFRYWIVFGKNISPSENGIYGTTFTSSAMNVVRVSDEIPSSFSLSQNYPNPFNPVTVVRFSLSVVSNVVLKVYDVRGQEVETLVNERMLAGSYQTEWDASGNPSGVYFYRMVTNGFSETKRMMLLK
ncbi:MAG: T9SS type A sorting domain-containing protein [Candidatus Kapaibacterium sp.]